MSAGYFEFVLSKPFSKALKSDSWMLNAGRFKKIKEDS